jgi:hypothetical protein
MRQHRKKMVRPARLQRKPLSARMVGKAAISMVLKRSVIGSCCRGSNLEHGH